MSERLSESNIQQTIVEEIRIRALARPQLKLLYAIPNGADVSDKNRARLAREGLVPGMPDLCFPVAHPSGGWIGLFVEVKALAGRYSTEQKRMASLLTKAGHLVRGVRSIQAGIDLISQYELQRNLNFSTHRFEVFHADD